MDPSGSSAHGHLLDWLHQRVSSTHTHPHSHTRTHTRRHTHTHSLPHPPTHTHIHTQTHTHTHTSVKIRRCVLGCAARCCPSVGCGSVKAGGSQGLKQLPRGLLTAGTTPSDLSKSVNLAGGRGSELFKRHMKRLRSLCAVSPNPQGPFE